MVVVPEPFHPVVNLPEEYWVFDFTRGEDKSWECPFDYQIEDTMNFDQACMKPKYLVELEIFTLELILVHL